MSGAIDSPMLSGPTKTIYKYFAVYGTVSYFRRCYISTSISGLVDRSINVLAGRVTP